MSESFLKRNERKLSFIAFIAGFIWDWLTIRYLDLPEAGLVLGIYLLVIATSVVIFNRIRSKITVGFFADKTAKFIPYLIQFMFGTLFNAAFIFYSASAELYSSWPFIVFLVIVAFANEIFHKRHNILAFQLTMFFVASFLYLVFAMPILIGEISNRVFVLSGGLSMFILFFLMFLLSRFAKERFLYKHVVFTIIILILYGVLNFLYFSNIIPPIPLAVKSAELYHFVKKTGNSYEVEYEPSQNDFWSKSSRIFHISSGESIYVFTPIFAPAKISTTIYHEWWHFDETNKKWVMFGKMDFSIVGGRKEGYRGYTLKQDVASGKWQVYITTQSGKHLGRISFQVENVKTKPILKQDII